MLSREDNERLCRVGPGTPMGNLFRRFWLPALLSREIAQPDSPPRRLRILGEDLVAFRDTNGRVGIMDAYCPHKLAQFFFGRNEECGLRCPYHGWKYDVDGNCVDLPNVENAENTKRKMKITAYQTREAGGVVWVYMGPPDKTPELPALEWTSLPLDHVNVTRWQQDTNWAQGMEGEIDSSHVSWLHRADDPEWELPAEVTSYPHGRPDGAPTLTLRETDYGFVYGARRRMHGRDDFFWRVTHWLAPMYSLIPNHRFPRTGRAWTPIDDEHVMTFGYMFHGERPLSQVEHDIIARGGFFPPRIEPATYELPDGYIIDTFLPVAHRRNDYLLDRAVKKSGNFTGIFGVNEQDRALQESLRPAPGYRQGRLVDRSRERLVASDVPVITARKILLRMADDLARGVEPSLPHHGERYRVRAIAGVSEHGAFDDFWSAPREREPA